MSWTDGRDILESMDALAGLSEPDSEPEDEFESAELCFRRDAGDAG